VSGGHRVTTVNSGAAPTAVWRDAPAYWQIVRSRIRTAVEYRQNTASLLVVVVIQVFILCKVWSALYDGQATVGGMPLHSLLAYLTLASLQNWVLADTTVARYIYTRIREGQVVFDLMRPVGYVPQMLAHLTGASIATSLSALVALPFVALAGTLTAPVSLAAAGLYAVSLLAGYAIALLLTLLVSLVAFWTMEIAGLTMLYSLVNQFFAGALVPLGFFPAPLRIIAELLPFQATTYAPVEIYVGRLGGVAALRTIGLQLAWIVFLGLVSRFMWRRAARRTVIQGG